MSSFLLTEKPGRSGVTTNAPMPRAPPVIGEGDVALRAVPHLAALAALHEGGVAPAVEEEDGLLPPLHPLPHRLHQQVAEHHRRRLLHGARGAAHPLALGRAFPVIGRRHRARSKILKAGNFHAPHPEVVQPLQQIRNGVGDEPRGQRHCQQNHGGAPARIGRGQYQAAPSQRTSSGATRVMSPAPSVSTTSPGRSS